MSDYEATIDPDASATIATIGDYCRATIRCRRLFAGDYRLLATISDYHTSDYLGLASVRGWPLLAVPGPFVMAKTAMRSGSERQNTP